MPFNYDIQEGPVYYFFMNEYDKLNTLRFNACQNEIIIVKRKSLSGNI